MAVPTAPQVVVIVVLSVLGALLLAACFFAEFFPQLFAGREARRKVRARRVAPEGAERLTAEELEAACARSGFTQDEALRLHGHFAAAAGGGRRAEASELLPGVPQLAGPLLPRLPAALKLQRGGGGAKAGAKGGVDFCTAISALGVFNERAPVDDKTRFLFRLYDGDGDGQISRSDLRSLLELVVPLDCGAAPGHGPRRRGTAYGAGAGKRHGDDEEAAAAEEGEGGVRSAAAFEDRERLIERAVEATFEELAGRGNKDGLGLEQFALVAGDLAAERGTAFF